jgi:histidinol-phosphate aminotransferase
MTKSKELHPLARKCLNNLSRPEVLYQRQALEKQCYFDLSSSINPYSPGPGAYPDLSCTQIKKAYRQHLTEEITEDEMLICRGITDGIDLLMRAFCEPGQDSVLIPEPTFFMYEYWAKANGVSIDKTKLIGEKFNRVDVSVVAQSGAKIVFLCSPNNPVGTVLEIEHITEIARATKALVVVDEAYIEFAKEPSSVRLLASCPNVVVLRTFSKAWGLAGMRCGVAIAHSSVINALSLVLGPFAIPENTQGFVSRYLEGRNSVMSQVACIQAERTRMASELKRSRRVQRIFPSEANFLLVEFDDAKQIHEVLLKRRIIVDPAWQHIPNTIRISIGKEIANNELLAAISSLR